MVPTDPATETGEMTSPTPSIRVQLRRLHAAMAPIVLAPLLLTVITGTSYRVLRDWAGLSRDQAHLLMVLHEGEWLKQWLGPDGETIYVLLNGLGLLTMVLSGGSMALLRLRRSWAGPRKDNT